MERIITMLWQQLKGFAIFLYPALKSRFLKLIRSAKGISGRNIVIDITDVASGLGMFLVLNILALLVFIAMPAGRDVLLAQVEDIVWQQSFWDKISNLPGLLAGVLIWSIASEFAARYAIYVTDNSAMSLDDKRVKFRKALQKTFAAFFLLLPFLIVIASLGINYGLSEPVERESNKWGYVTLAVIFYFLFTWICRWYFRVRSEANRRRIMEKRNSSWFWRLVTLPDQEKIWAEKLYGIYNYHVYAFPKPENFKGPVNTVLRNFTDRFVETGDVSEKLSFPQDENKLIPAKKIPQQFRLIGFSNEPTKDEGNYFWKYKIPLSFYRTLHRQVRIISVLSLLLLLVIALLPVDAYSTIGSPGLIFISFACICGLYVGTIFVDYTNSFFKAVPLRALAVLLFIASSYFNQDHPVRMQQMGKTVNMYDNRPGLKAHFINWADNFINDSNNKYVYHDSNNNIHDTCYPALFVCAEGGAMRTGAFSAYTLSLIRQNELDTNAVDLDKKIYAMSGVSGGSLGLGFYNASHYLNTFPASKDNNDISRCSHFFENDYLSPLIGKMFFGELLQLFIPWHIERFDRAIALETAWENGYASLLNQDQPNTFKDFFIDTAVRSHPALFINTTEVESGLQCWMSNLKPDPESMLFSSDRDLLNVKIKDGVNYSTAINFSSRFPGFSPGGAVTTANTNRRLHYVDGGYVENTGAATMLEILKSLQAEMKQRRIKPFVLMFRYSKETTGSESEIKLFNELTEILYGIYNTRSGRTKTAVEELKRFTKNVFGTELCLLPLPANTQVSPQNWVLSKRNFTEIKKNAYELWRYRKTKDLNHLFFIDTVSYTKLR